jgi:lipopolysaccharide assembly protein A
MRPKVIITILLAVLFVMIVIQNTEVVTLRFLFWKFSMSRIILMAVILLIGFVGGYIVAKITGTRHTK